MFAGFTELTELPPLVRFSISMLILFANQCGCQGRGNRGDG